VEVQKMQELSKLASNQIKFATDYAECRKRAGKAKSEIDIILAANISKIREQKSNAGYEFAVLMLIEIVPEVKDLYDTMINETAKYKGLERIIESIRAKISLEQSIMRYVKDSGG